jgi:hypothetical protein
VVVGGYWVCDACKSLNEPRYTTCYKCHVKRGQAKPQPIIPGATVARPVSEVYGVPVVSDLKGPSLLAALLLGGAVAVFLTWVWYYTEAEYHFGRGRIAWGVGLFIAVAVLVAGTLGGRRRVSFMLPFISFALTLASVVIGEYLIISAELAVGKAVPLGSIPLATFGEVAKAAGDYLASDPIRPILWFVALAAAWLIPFGVLVGSNREEED